VRAQIERRRTQEEFVARGLASREKARRSGKYISSTIVLKGIESRLTKAKKKSA
jgi:hypothetical protein